MASERWSEPVENAPMKALRKFAVQLPEAEAGSSGDNRALAPRSLVAQLGSG